MPARIPWVSYTLLGLTTLVFLLQLATQQLLGYDLPSALGAKVNELIVAGQFWRLLTPAFLHAGFLHFAFNMYALYVLGPSLERLYGHERFIYLYFLGALAGNTFSFLFSPNPSLGASTAIFALLAGQVVYIYQNRRIYRNSRAMLTNVLVILGVNILFSLNGTIDFWGHIGGLIGGSGVQLAGRTGVGDPRYTHRAHRGGYTYDTKIPYRGWRVVRLFPPDGHVRDL